MSALSFNKDPSDSAEFSLDFTAALSAIGAGSETIASASWTLASGLTEVSKSNTDQVARIVISGGTAGEELPVSCQITTSGGKTISDGFLLRIIDQPPNVSGALTTIGRVAAELGITDDTHQAILADLILEATAAIEEYCGRTFARATVTENLAGYGSAFLRVSRAPITSITSISVEGSALSTDSYRIHNAKNGLIHGFFENTGQRRQDASQTLIAGSEQKLYEVVYVGGYYLPGSANRNLPRDIEHACVELVKQMFHGLKSNPRVRKESVPNVYSVEYSESGQFLEPDRMASLLNRHKIPEFV